MFWSEPFKEMERMKKLFKRMMDENFGGFMEFVDISETGEDVIVKAYLPQFKKDEISVKATARTLEILAQHKEKKVEEKKGIYETERKFGEFRKFMTLPVEVDYQKAESKFENGSLVIRLPKNEKKKVGKEIKIR
jgi:HSP20 family protein